MYDIKVVTQENVIYDFFVASSKLHKLTVNEAGTAKNYCFDAQDEATRLTPELLSTALEELLRVKPHDFDLVSLCLYQEDLEELAVKVYKKVMDEFYNMGIAASAFNRCCDASIEETINTTYTLFGED